MMSAERWNENNENIFNPSSSISLIPVYSKQEIKAEYNYNNNHIKYNDIAKKIDRCAGPKVKTPKPQNQKNQVPRVKGPKPKG
jgi:hypothetical protein